jgi:biopolymer transport protein ExbD
MTSMIDVVFLLLIFFLTTSSFVQTERNLDPAIQLQEKSAQAASPFEPAIVEVVRSGGRDVFRLGGRDTTSLEELTRLLRSFPDKSEGAFVQVEDAVSFAAAAAAIQACKSAGFVLVSYVPEE